MDPNVSQFILAGRNWARGWNQYEAKTMRWLVAILTIMLFLGFAVGLVFSIDLSLPWYLAVPVILLLCFFMLFLGIVLARIVTPFIWDALLTQGLER